MKLLWVTTFYHPRTDGVAKLSKVICEALAEKGVEVIVHTLRFEDFPSFEKINGVSIKRYDFFRFLRYLYSKDMYKGIIAEKDVDIVHAHHWGYYPLSCAAKASKKMGVPLVMNAYYHPPVLKGIARKIKRWVFSMLENKKIFDSVDTAFAITDLEKKQIEELGAKKVIKIPLPVDTEKNRPFGSVRDQILYCGSLSTSKGFDKFLKLATKIHEKWPNQKIKVVGKKHSSVEFEYSDYPFIDFRSGISEKELIDEYNGSLMLVSPSQYESFGLAIAECMSCETPIVSLRNGSIPEIVGDTGFLYEDDDWEKMMEGISILMDSDESSVKGKLARKRIVDLFNKDKIIDMMIQNYGNIIKK